MHIPVLLEEVIRYLDPKPGQKFIDATINGGGHGEAILKKITSTGKLLGIELDPVIYRKLKMRVENESIFNNLTLVNENYTDLLRICKTNDFMGADGILFDLGMSSWHIASGERGFTFLKDEPLDMRYNSETYSETAADILNGESEEEIANLIYEYGEERYSRLIAREIVSQRKISPIKTTFELIEIIKKAVPFRYRVGRIHYATRTFQALRIAVNHELENVETGLKEAIKAIGNGGRIAVISFHSLEDRIVKRFFKQKSEEDILKIITKKPIQTGYEEKRQNPGARSAKLRVAEKIT